MKAWPARICGFFKGDFSFGWAAKHQQRISFVVLRMCERHVPCFAAPMDCRLVEFKRCLQPVQSSQNVGTIKDRSCQPVVCWAIFFRRTKIGFGAFEVPQSGSRIAPD